MRLLLLLCGCWGIRHVARPPTTDGYKSVAVRDIPAVGMKDVNVEVVGTLGPMVPQEVCGGLVTYPLLDAGGGFFMTSGVTLSLPRMRYNELRALHPRKGDDPLRGAIYPFFLCKFRPLATKTSTDLFLIYA